MLNALKGHIIWSNDTFEGRLSDNQIMLKIFDDHYEPGRELRQFIKNNKERSIKQILVRIQFKNKEKF